VERAGRRGGLPLRIVQRERHAGDGRDHVVESVAVHVLDRDRGRQRAEREVALCEERAVALDARRRRDRSEEAVQLRQ